MAEQKRAPKTHELKTWPAYFEPVSKGAKSFEVRQTDRDFQAGDTLHLREFSMEDWPWIGGYSGRECKKCITYILRGGNFGIDSDMAILSLDDVPLPIDDWHEDMGDMLWWRFPIVEPPYIGNPLMSDFPEDHVTHFTPYTVPPIAVWPVPDAPIEDMRKSVNRTIDVAALYSQYFRMKAARPNTIPLIRVGDFYETYGEDALTIARELELCLSSRSMGTMQPVSMAGFPVHVLGRCLEWLSNKGYSVSLAFAGEEV